ncbi:hypothetical protein Tco_0397804 [Tanacetum coccineum]
MYTKYMPLEDEYTQYTQADEHHCLLLRKKSPTADSPGYVPESDPEEEPEADDDEDPEEDPYDYPADHDDDDEEEEPSKDDADDEDEDEDEEEEHSAPADSVPPVHRMTARISIRDEPSISLPPREEDIYIDAGSTKGQSDHSTGIRLAMTAILFRTVASRTERVARNDLTIDYYESSTSVLQRCMLVESTQQMHGGMGLRVGQKPDRTSLHSPVPTLGTPVLFVKKKMDSYSDAH